MKYRAKEEIEAIQFTRNNWEELVAFTNGKIYNLQIEKRPGGKAMCKLESGTATLAIDEYDYIVKDLRMGPDDIFFSRRKKEVFENKYVPVQNHNQLDNKDEISEFIHLIPKGDDVMVGTIDVTKEITINYGRITTQHRVENKTIEARSIWTGNGWEIISCNRPFNE